jgi:hypothetical protein
MNEDFTQIIELVAADYPMDIAKILNLKCGDKEAPMARYMIYSIMLKKGYSIYDIAHNFGGRAENVSKAIKRFNTWLRIYPLTKLKYNEIERKALV